MSEIKDRYQRVVTKLVAKARLIGTKYRGKEPAFRLDEYDDDWDWQEELLHHCFRLTAHVPISLLAFLGREKGGEGAERGGKQV